MLACLVSIKGETKIIHVAAENLFFVVRIVLVKGEVITCIFLTKKCLTMPKFSFLSFWRFALTERTTSSVATLKIFSWSLIMWQQTIELRSFFGFFAQARKQNWFFCFLRISYQPHVALLVQFTKILLMFENFVNVVLTRCLKLLYL